MKQYPLMLAVCAVAGTFTLAVGAAVPAFITYSGRLTDGTGWGVSVQLDVTFSLYDAETAGDRLWQQAFQDVAVADGYFSVVFGEGVDPDTSDPVLVTDVFAEYDQVWLTVAVDGGLELWPRQPIGSVPYAIKSVTTVSADNAAALGGLATASWQKRMALQSARAMCRAVSGNSTGSVYEMPLNTLPATICSQNGKTCYGRVWAPAPTSDENTKWSSDGTDGCDDPNGGTPGWYACCSL